MKSEWRLFKDGNWSEKIDVANFIALNYKEYQGDE